MTDLELMDKFIEECRDHVHPLLLRDISNRGLYSYINRLPYSISEAKMVLRARLAAAGKYYGDPEIDYVAGQIGRMKVLQGQLAKMNMADAHQVKPILAEMQEINNWLLDYYK